MTVALRFGARSDVGLVRKSNQDSGYAGPHLLVLADGMGGPAGGDIASSVAIAHLAPLDEDVHGADDLLPLLRRSVEAAHSELVDRSRADPELAGLGTTCIAVLRSGNKLAMVHIGDSRAYLLRDGVLTQVTTDHTFVQYLVDSGRLTPEEAESHPQRNVIMRALGDTEGEVELDESMREARVGDRWLLAYDGLFGVVSAETIGQALADVDEPGLCAEALVELSLRGGAPDNVTCVVADVVSITGDGPKPELAPQVVGSAARDRSAATRGGQNAAGRAASLLTTDDEDEDDEEPGSNRGRAGRGSADDDPDENPRRGRVAALVAVVALLLAAALGYVGYRWTQTQYYVASSGGYVAIYQGIPQNVGPLSLSHLHERTGLSVDSLTPLAQQRLAETITRASLPEAEEVVANLADQVRPVAPDPTESPAPEDPAATGDGTDAPANSPEDTADQGGA